MIEKEILTEKKEELKIESKNENREDSQIKEKKEKENEEEEKENKKEEKKEEDNKKEEENKEENKKEEEKKDQNIIFKASCRLFRYDPKKNEIVGRGIGKSMIIFDIDSNYYKIVMERDRIKRLGCNHYVDPNSELEPHIKYENTWTWNTKHDKIDDIDNGSEQTFIIKFNNENDSNIFKEKYIFARDHNIKILKENKK